MPENNLNIPEHVAIILDGNGRWAKKRLLPRNAGHAQGSKVVEQICEDAFDLGIKYLTVYAFSKETVSYTPLRPAYSICPKTKKSGRH